jgi:peptidyl-prolyl cis-trans isomerase SurA
LSTNKSAVLLAACALTLAGCKPHTPADVVATVNGHPILRADLDKAYTDNLGDAANQAPQQTQEYADSLRLQLLSQLISEETIQQRAAKMNLSATPEEVDAKLNEMKQSYTEEQFAARLSEHHTTVEEIKRDLRRSLTVNKLLNKEINQKITISDADISNYFNAHKADFNIIEPQYHIAQILVTDTPDPHPCNLQNSKASNDAEAKKKISQIKNSVDSGMDFGTVAMNLSENCTTAPNGGDMGSISESKLKASAGPLFNLIAALKPGQTTDILPFPDPGDPTGKRIGGYAIFQLLSHDPAGQHTISEPQVQQHIRQEIREGRSQLLKTAYFEMLRDQAKVENFFAEQVFKDDAH